MIRDPTTGIAGPGLPERSRGCLSQFCFQVFQVEQQRERSGKPKPEMTATTTERRTPMGVTLTRFADQCGLSYSSLMRIQRKDPIPTVWLGRNRIVRPGPDVDAWLKRHRQA
jgi:hypothetical protein